jgi:glutamyl-tRNA synthetase
VGGARTALYNWALAERSGGTFVLRIEDTDESRNEPQWVEGIIDALSWLGINPSSPLFEGPYFQSDNATKHVEAAHLLYANGHAYWCDLTSEQIQERAKASGKQGYDGYSRDRGLQPGPNRVLRFRVPEGVTVVDDLVRGRVEFDNTTIEDFVLLRSNGSPMFLLANVVDDMEMNITNVVRAEEHLPNTPKQQMIWDALGAIPPIWAHVPVLVNEQRKKLSKRRDKVALEQYKSEGILPAAMINYLMTLGWAPHGDNEIVPWSTIVEQFRLEDVNHSPAFFDEKKLHAFNGEYIRALSVEEFTEVVQPWLSQDVPWTPEQFKPEVFNAMAPLVQTRIGVLRDTPAMVDFLFLSDPVIDDVAWKKAMAPEWAALLLQQSAEQFASCDWNHDSLKSVVESTGEIHGVKLGKAQAPVRVAITGKSVGPPLFESIELLGRDETIRRLHNAMALLS